MRCRTSFLVAVAFPLLLGACAEVDPPDELTPFIDDGKGDGIGACLPSVAHQRAFAGLTFQKPVAMLQAPGDRTRFFVVEHGGTIRAFASDPATTSTTPFLDLRSRTKVIYESGMNGLAFSPAWATTREAYVTYNAPPPVGGTHLERWRLSRFTSRDGGKTLDPTSEEILIELDKDADEHNAGGLGFGADGLLYVSIGDGGPSFDPRRFGENTTVLFGKFIRIDVNVRPSTGPRYGIPATNPFARGGGRPEIYAWGLRNPWRWSFDRTTNTIWAGDVGQDAFEEIDQIEIGRNYGWSSREANHCFSHTPCADVASNIKDPVVELPHPDARAVIGGYVYRGQAIPALRGTYLFGDFVSGKVSALFPDARTGKLKPSVIDATGKSIAAFAEDLDGELYVLDYSFGQIFKLTAGACKPAAPPDGRNYKFLMRSGISTAKDADAYYLSIVPGFQPNIPSALSLDQWKAEHIGSLPVATAFYRNKMDLGFWREMTCSTVLGRGRGGCLVRNWTDPDDQKNGKPNLGTVTMDVSAEGFTRFYVFSPGGTLQPFAILDNEGQKFVPQVCNTCHGGHYQGVGSSADLGAIFREFEPSLLQEKAGLTRAQAEAEWFALNQAIRAANVSIHAESEGAPVGTDHNKKAILEYIDAMYVTTSPPVSRSASDPAHLPATWNGGSHPFLASTKRDAWTRVVNPYCMGCHRTNTFDFADYNIFASLASIQEGQAVLSRYVNADLGDPSSLVMPQARLTYDNLRADAVATAAMEDWLTEASNPAVPQTRVQLEVTNAGFTFFGQDIWIVGSIPELGAWDPKKALKLSGDAFPTWRGAVTLPQGTKLEYKAVAISSWDGAVLWEQGANRTLTVPKSVRVAVSSAWRF